MLPLLALFDILARPLAESVLTSLRAVFGLYFYYVFLKVGSCVALCFTVVAFHLESTLPHFCEALKLGRLCLVGRSPLRPALLCGNFRSVFLNVRLAFALCTCAFWICHTFPWFVRVHFRKYCLFCSSPFVIVQPYRIRCVSTVECPC